VAVRPDEPSACRFTRCGDAPAHAASTSVVSVTPCSLSADVTSRDVPGGVPERIHRRVRTPAPASVVIRPVIGMPDGHPAWANPGLAAETVTDSTTRTDGGAGLRVSADKPAATPIPRTSASARPSPWWRLFGSKTGSATRSAGSRTADWGDPNVDVPVPIVAGSVSA